MRPGREAVTSGTTYEIVTQAASRRRKVRTHVVELPATALSWNGIATCSRRQRPERQPGGLASGGLIGSVTCHGREQVLAWLRRRARGYAAPERGGSAARRVIPATWI